VEALIKAGGIRLLAAVDPVVILTSQAVPETRPLPLLILVRDLAALRFSHPRLTLLVYMVVVVLGGIKVITAVLLEEEAAAGEQLLSI
jgi:hypothetical protein